MAVVPLKRSEVIKIIQSQLDSPNTDLLVIKDTIDGWVNNQGNTESLNGSALVKALYGIISPDGKDRTQISD